MEKKIFWLLVAVLSIVADMYLPLMWGLLLTIPIIIVSWWVAYKSGWFV